MTDISLGFCAGNLSDPKVVKETLLQLRRMIRFGKLAERSLKKLREDGFCDSRTPVVERSKGWGDVYGLRLVRFPKKVGVSREDMPDWGNVSLKLGETFPTRHSNRPLVAVKVFLCGTVLNQKSDEDGIPIGGFDVVKAKELIGSIRMLKGQRLSFVDNDSVTILKNDAKTEAFIARLVAKNLVNFCGSTYRNEIPQKFLDLKKFSKEWLIEDGIAKQLLQSIFDSINILKVLEA